MALTRNVKETVRARMERDPGFRQALLEEGIERLLAGEVDLGKAVLRDYVNATIGFRELGDLTAKSPKSLMRMLGPDGNPQARHLFKIIGCLQEREGLGIEGSRAPVSACAGTWGRRWRSTRGCGSFS